MSAVPEHVPPAAPASPSLAIKDVSKWFGSLRALFDVSFDVQPGERRAIIGPNGAGKTSLFNIIGGQWRASSGSVSLFGRPVDRLSPHRRAHLGIARTFQITNLFQQLTVKDNLYLALQGLARGKLHPLKPNTWQRSLHRQADEILEQAHLAHRRATPLRSLSYGEQRILEVLVALASKPKVLLVDEPTAGLSPSETEEMVERLQSLDPELTLILIEHDMDVCFRLVDRITVLHHGTVIADGERDEVRADPRVQEIYLGKM